MRHYTIMALIIWAATLGAQCPTYDLPIVNGYRYINGIVPGDLIYAKSGSWQVFEVSGYRLSPKMPQPSADGYFQFNWKYSTNGGNSFRSFQPECDAQMKTDIGLLPGTLVRCDIWFVDKTARFSIVNNFAVWFTVPQDSVTKPGPMKRVDVAKVDWKY